MHRRRLLLACLALVLGAIFTPLRAETHVFYSRGGSAIDGYDTVAYFTLGKPVEGHADIAVMWKGAVWYFSSQANRERFEANPWAYAPQYGGYCAYGVSLGYRDTTEPEIWQIVNGKLYLIHTDMVLSLWKMDISGHITNADSNWPNVLSQ